MVPLLIAMAAAQTVPVSPPPATQSVVSLFSVDDYPPMALSLGWQGKVVVKLRIGIDGRPRACRIVHSSGHDELDIATCKIMLTRARFSPARDKNGNPVEDDFETPPIEWRIAEPVPEPQPEQGEAK